MTDRFLERHVGEIVLWLHDTNQAQKQPFSRIERPPVPRKLSPGKSGQPGVNKLKENDQDEGRGEVGCFDGFEFQ